jgi:ubiquinone/menaquinone biosynthesis C-methylase UbiE
VPVGREIETRDHVTGFQEEIAKVANTSGDDFFTWFNQARNKEAAFIRGSWDFMLHIAAPAAPYLAAPEEKIALEIGHGGGRLLAAASKSFARVIGIDIHDQNQVVEDELHARGIQNFQLIQVTGREIPLASASVDFIYSFIVLQHVERHEIFDMYLREAYRLLRPNGVAVLYFGRKYLFSINRSSSVLYWLDRMLERVLLAKGYKEMPARVNETNLLISLHYAKKLARRIGFHPQAELVSRKTVPDGVRLYGGQNGLILTKQA